MNVDMMTLSPFLCQVCVLMTDGQQTDFKVSYTPPHKAVKPLRMKGVEVFTMGITGDIDVDELVKTASGPDHCYSTEYFYELERKTQEMGKTICTGRYLKIESDQLDYFISRRFCFLHWYMSKCVSKQFGRPC